MSAPVAIVGVGVVGGRAARELISGDSTGVVLGTSRPERRTELKRVFGSSVRTTDPDDAVSAATRVVVLTGPGRRQVEAAELHLGEGRHVVTTVDAHDDAADLLALDALARETGRSLVVGSCFSPGLSDVLVAHASGHFDSVDEVYSARHGAAGQLCEAQRRAALCGSAQVLRSGELATRPAGDGRELCWFPDPVGGLDAYLAGTAEPVLAKWALPTLQRSSARITSAPLQQLLSRLPLPIPGMRGSAEGGVGAIRVEVRGLLGGGRHSVVLGALDRPGVASAALIAELVGALLEGDTPSGAFSAGSLVPAGRLLKRLRNRGVRVARLSGDPENELPPGNF